MYKFIYIINFILKYELITYLHIMTQICILCIYINMIFLSFLATVCAGECAHGTKK